MEKGKYLIWAYMSCFDHDCDDFGVGAYLEKVQRVPDGVCALVVHTDFLHFHEGMEKEYLLPPETCGYRGDPGKLTAEERAKASWTNYQLRGLVRELHSRGIEMFISVMGVYRQDLFHREWLSDHQEVRLQTRRGVHELNVLKRLRDGSWYEDFFREKTLEVMRDYGFDGIHLCDVLSPLPAPLADCDYSTDMILQFEEHTGLRLPEALEATVGDDSCESKRARQAWIWRERRVEWIRFYDWRWTEFYRKLCSGMHELGCKVATLGMYVTDPFQSVYAFGIDVRHLAKAGVDFFTANVVATGLNLNDHNREPWFHRFMTFLPAMKAQVRETPIYQMLGVRDDAEEWDVIHHAPNQFERDVYTGLSYQFIRPDGMERCVEKPYITLGDSIDEHDWKLINFYLDAAYSLRPREVCSPVWYWSEGAFDALLEEYIRTRRVTAPKLMARLQENGAICGGVVREEGLSRYAGAVVSPDFDLLPERERKMLLESGRPILAFAAVESKLDVPGVTFRFSDRESNYPMEALLIHAEAPENRAEYEALMDEPDGGEDLSGDLMMLDDDIDFMGEEMRYQKVSMGFRKAAAMLFRYLDGKQNPFRANAPITAYLQEDGSYRVNVWNRYEGSYDLALVECKEEIDEVQILGSFPYLPVKFVSTITDAYADITEMMAAEKKADRKAFQVKLRPTDMAILRVTIK